jgi:hypothetical protein
MLSVYVPRGTSLERVAVEPGQSPPQNAEWVDMVTPTVQEDKPVEGLLGIAVPTREEMQEIEVSSPQWSAERRASHRLRGAAPRKACRAASPAARGACATRLVFLGAPFPQGGEEETTVCPAPQRIWAMAFARMRLCYLKIESAKQERWITRAGRR